jgi:endoglucanase
MYVKKTNHLIIIAIFSCSILKGEVLNIDNSILYAQTMGNGININYTLKLDEKFNFENYEEDLIELRKLGFRHVRLPIDFSNISAIEKTKKLVDIALKEKFLIVIDMHKFKTIKTHPLEQEEQFIMTWLKISKSFKEYNNKISFEILNEPNGNLTTEGWFKLARKTINSIRTISPQRIIILGTPNFNSINQLDTIPKNLINNRTLISIHYYYPMGFTHYKANWTNNSYLKEKWDNIETIKKIESDFKNAYKWSREHDIPLYLGEFGAFSSTSKKQRFSWLSKVSSLSNQYNIPWALWDLNSGFGIKNNDQYNQELLSSLHIFD